MRRWLRRLQSELDDERKDLERARAASRAVIHEVADVVLQLRAASEHLEQIMQDLAAQEGEEGEDYDTPS